MAGTDAHLVDRVLPEVPLRQWMLTLPFSRRYRLAYDRRLPTPVLAACVRAVFASLRRRPCEKLGIRHARCCADDRHTHIRVIFHQQKEGLRGFAWVRFLQFSRISPMLQRRQQHREHLASQVLLVA